ncbi:unnamed protein product [Calypogeia fissa]
MGNSQGATRGSVEYETASKAFSQSELEKMKKVYISLAAQSRSQGEYVSASAFQAFFGIRGSLGIRLFDMVTQMRKDQRLYFEDFVIAKATYEKGSPSEMEDFMFQLLDLAGDGKVQKTEVESVMLSILVTVLGSKDGVTEANLPEDSLQAFLSATEYSENSEEEAEPCMSMKDFRKMCTAIPSIKKFLASLLTPPRAGPAGRQIPKLVIPESFGGSPILRAEHAWHISGILQQQDTQGWALLYHSSMNGLSFNTFMGNVLGVGGPTILVIKDKEGCVHGGYASQPWEKHPDFYGDMKCFLFTLQPRVSIYRPTGSNNNLQWCAYNYISESIPNGIGFGGQIHHFGLFVAGSFDRGHTRYSVTFGNPALSTKEDIIPQTIECWGVLGNDEGPDGAKLKGTCLERFKEDRQFLNMVGRANATDSIGPE